VKTAFLCDDIEEKIYMTQPTGFKTAERKTWYEAEEIVLWLKQPLRAVVQ